MSVHRQMPREERAKQFMPFAALKGYPEALRRKEEEVRRACEEDKGERCEADAESVDREV